MVSKEGRIVGVRVDLGLIQSTKRLSPVTIRRIVAFASGRWQRFLSRQRP